MKKKAILFIFAVFTFGFLSCATVNDIRSSGSSDNWDGAYEGIIPAADTSGIQALIILNRNETYIASYVYLDTDGEIFNYNGTFKWNKKGSVITLEGSSIPSYYRVEENALRQLDTHGKVIRGNLADNYVLRKIQ
ncbi:MAG: copper resistance protein NlpE [Treponema sp.]|nr:copper resistance protein NlpE [Treponema sp.]MCL2272917.1 copper resistance protein NlpE [Treponema sp.]